jgi:hypothetical protein
LSKKLYDGFMAISSSPAQRRPTAFILRLDISILFKEKLYDGFMAIFSSPD